MKKLSICLLAFLLWHATNAQNFSELSNYEFSKVESYKTEQSKVLQCANFLFDNPSNKQEGNRLTAVQYIMKWMTGTPDYTFDIGEKAMELTKGNPDLLGLYLAAMTKTVLDNKGDALSKGDIHNAAENILVAYCSNSDNKMKPSKKIKKIIKSRKK